MLEERERKLEVQLSRTKAELPERNSRLFFVSLLEARLKRQREHNNELYDKVEKQLQQDPRLQRDMDWSDESRVEPCNQLRTNDWEEDVCSALCINTAHKVLMEGICMTIKSGSVSLTNCMYDGVRQQNKVRLMWHKCLPLIYSQCNPMESGRLIEFIATVMAQLVQYVSSHTPDLAGTVWSMHYALTQKYEGTVIKASA